MLLFAINYLTIAYTHAFIWLRFFIFSKHNRLLSFVCIVATRVFVGRQCLFSIDSFHFLSTSQSHSPLNRIPFFFRGLALERSTLERFHFGYVFEFFHFLSDLFVCSWLDAHVVAMAFSLGRWLDDWSVRVDELWFVGGEEIVDEVFFGFVWLSFVFGRKVKQVGFFLGFGAVSAAFSVGSTGYLSLHRTGFLKQCKIVSLVLVVSGGER